MRWRSTRFFECIGFFLVGGCQRDFAAVSTGLKMLQKRTRAARAKNPEVRAVIAADGSARHQSVVSILDTLRKEGVFRFALNVDPDELSRP